MRLSDWQQRGIPDCLPCGAVLAGCAWVERVERQSAIERSSAIGVCRCGGLLAFQEVGVGRLQQDLTYQHIRRACGF
jgi:hypothetical protein